LESQRHWQMEKVQLHSELGKAAESKESMESKEAEQLVRLCLSATPMPDACP